MDDWRWGEMHTVQLDAVVPVGIIGTDNLSIPVPGDATFPNGFPRHGDRTFRHHRQGLGPGIRRGHVRLPLPDQDPQTHVAPL